MVACALVLTGCRQIFGIDHPQLVDAPTTDTLQVDTLLGPMDAADAEVPLGPWGTPSLVFPGSGSVDDDPTLTGDLLEIYFNRANLVYGATRASVTDAWSMPSVVSPLGSPDTTPEVSLDGLTMYVASSRPGTLGANDIMMSTRATKGDMWSTPTFVTELDTPSEDNSGDMTLDGLEIVFGSSRAGTADLYTSTRAATTDAWGTPTAIAELDTASIENSPFLTGDGLTIYFDSNRLGTTDLFVATRTDRSSPFSTPTLISELSTAIANEEDPWVSPDGHLMLFVSDGAGHQQIYQSTR